MGRNPGRIVAVAVTLLLLGAALPVKAQLTSDELNCQNTVAKQGKKLFGKTFKALSKCEDKVSKGDLPLTTDCTLDATAAAKIADAQGKFGDKVADKCTDALVAALDFGGQCFGVTTEAALTACAIAEHDAAAQALIELIFPHTVCNGGQRIGQTCTVNADCPVNQLAASAVCTAVPNPLDSDQRKCQKLLGKTIDKQARKRQTALQKCKNHVSKGILPPDTNCIVNAQAKLADILASSQEKIASACPDAVAATLKFSGVCANETDSEAVAACSLCSDDRQIDDLILVQYGGSAYGPTASAQQITDVADCVEGPLSRCRVDDYLLANDKIRVVIQDVQRNMFGIGQFGGQIIDADLVRTGLDPERDNFEEWSFALNIENTAHYTSLTIINDGSNGGPAVIRATGPDDLLDFLNPSTTLAGFGFLLPPAQDDKDLPVSITTDYILEPGKNYVRVETTVTNTGATHLDVFLGEFLNGSGQVEIFQPGPGFGEPLVTNACGGTPTSLCFTSEPRRNFVAYGGYDEADGVSYGYVHNVPYSTSFTTGGVTVPLLGVEVVNALIGLSGPPFDIEPMGDPNDSLSLTRYFLVGESISSITDIRNDIQCVPTGSLQGTVTAGGSPAAEIDVSILGNLGAVPIGLDYNLVTHTRTNAAGQYALTLAPGNYNVVFNLDGYPYEGGGSSPQQNPVTIVTGQTATQNGALPATGSLQVLVDNPGNQPLPAKASVVGFDPSPEIDNTQTVAIINNRTGVFGDFEDERPFGVAKSIFIDPTGDSGVVPIEPGTYEVVVSRGPEYSISTTNVPVTAAPDPPAVVNATIEPVLDTTGFIAADFHVHGIHSPDSETSERDRVVSQLAEGVDFFTPSEHDIRIDYQPTVDALAAGTLISIAQSGEITTFDYGHFNAWPMTIDAAQVNGGSVDHGGAELPGEDFPIAPYNSYSLTPAAIIAAAHADPGTDTVQVNHIHSHFGLDGGSGLAIDTGVEPPQSGSPAAAHRLDPGVSNFFTDTFDALEIWIGDDRSQIYDNFLGITDPATGALAARGGNIGDWFNLINQGIISTGIADSDTHRRHLTQSGVPRSMVASPTDVPGALGAIADTLSGHVNDGRVVGTNAPMVRVTASAASTTDLGGLELPLPTLITTTDGEVDINVDIQSPAWAKFDRVEYYVNTTTTQRTITGLQTGAGAINLNRYVPTPDFVQNAPADFAVNSMPVGGSSRWEATTTLNLTGLTEDIWVVVLVKGTDGLSEPLFPMIPNNLQQNTNTTLAQLTDGNLGERGITALAFTNPLFVDVDGGGWTAPGVQIAP